MAVFRKKLTAICAKIETTSGTDSVPTLAANIVRTVGVPVLQLAYMDGGSRDDVVFAQLGTIERAQPVGRHVTFSVTLEAKGSLTAFSSSNKPEADVFLRAAGFSSTFSGGASSEIVTYTTLDSALETMTVYGWDANYVLYKIVGCVAKPKIVCAANARGLITFECMGVLSADPIAATGGNSLVGATLGLNLTVPPLFAGGQITVGSWAYNTGGDPLVCTRCEIDTGTVTVERPSAGATDGLIGWVITDRKVRQIMEVEPPAFTTLDLYAASKSVLANMPTSSWQLTGAQYNTMKVFTGKWALEVPKPVDRSGLALMTLEGNLVAGTESTSNREVRIVFS